MHYLRLDPLRGYISHLRVVLVMLPHSRRDYFKLFSRFIDSAIKDDPSGKTNFALNEHKFRRTLGDDDLP